MKLQNSTDFPDAFLRRMTAWCAARASMPACQIRHARFVKSKNAFSGVCYSSKRFTVRVGPARLYPVNHTHAGYSSTFTDPIEALVHVTAHEVYHCHQFKNSMIQKYARIEAPAERNAVQALDAFRADRESLLAKWAAEPARATQPKAKPSVVEARALAADAKLAEWTRKLKLAQTKVRGYRKRVAYYAKRQAACPSPK